MRDKKSVVTFAAVLIFCTSALFAKEKSGKIALQKSTVIGVIDTMAINNIFLPFQNDGSTGEDGSGFYPNGTQNSFLYQGGMAATGYVDGQLRASWMAKASLIQEFQPGSWGMSPDDGRATFYKVTASDGPGSPNYVRWSDAVALGADFQDVDGDGRYDPLIDHPDMIGDRISWSVINDGTDVSIRADGLLTDPIGLEIHQQVWAFARGDELGDVVFFRYRFTNPTDTDVDSLIFSIWTDPDIGEPTDDLIGCDTTLSLGYIYNNGDDPQIGLNPPAFGIDFFQGPVVDSPGDVAFLFRGPFFGVDTLRDMRSLPMTSFMFYNNGGTVLPGPTTAQIARNYQKGGLDANGLPVDPENWGGGGSASTNPKFFFSGDPVTGNGWIDTDEADKRFLVNTGPFQLPAGETQDIVVAYVVAQGTDALESVNAMKRSDDLAQQAYNANFFIAGPPPPPVVTARTFDERVELIIDLSQNGTFAYDIEDELFNRQVFEGVRIYQMSSPSTNAFENGILNRKLVATLDLDNQYTNLFLEAGNSVSLIMAGSNSLDGSKILDKDGAILRYTIDTDQFATGGSGPLVNNTEYFFSVTAFSINVNQLQDLEGGDWRGGSGILLENSLGGKQLIRVIPGRDENRPFLGIDAEYSGARSHHDGNVYVDVVDREALSGDEYAVSFFGNGEFWRVDNLSRNQMLMDSIRFQDLVGGEEWSFPIIDGLSVKTRTVTDRVRTLEARIDSSDANNMIWLTGNGRYLDGGTSISNGAADLVSNVFGNTFSVIRRDEYFQVKLVFDVEETGVAHNFFANWNVLRGIQPTFASAYDISDPDDPRRLNIAYYSPSGSLNFLNTELIVFSSDYSEDGRYSAVDSLFRAEAFMLFDFSPVDNNLQNNVLEFIATPAYPNSDLDEYRFSSGLLFPELATQQRQDLLQNVGVVPNPFWAYSTYETSYDTPVMKFIHLDQQVTIRIFNLAGQLVRTLNKDDDLSELAWNLRNQDGLKVASGMYIAHVEVPGIGAKVLKLAIVQREERIDRF